MADLDHLSYSSISLYLTCGRAWYFRYVAKVLAPVSPELAFGSAFHDAIEAFIASPERDVAHCIRLWPEHWAKRCTQEIAWGTEQPEEYFNLGLRMLGHPNVQEIIGRIQLLWEDGHPAVERKVALRVPGVPLPVIGFIDLIGADGVPGDIKTSSSSWSPERAQREAQSLFYLAALNQTGQLRSWRFRHYVFIKTKEPKAQILEHTHEPREIFWLFQSIGNVWRQIEQGCYPENFTSWKCTPQYCEYWHLCRGK